MQYRLGTIFLLALGASLTSAAQVVVPPGTYPHQVPVRKSGQNPPTSPSSAIHSAPMPMSQAKPMASVPAGVKNGGQGPTSLLDQASSPATVELTNGKLSVDANNSSLLAVLRQIAADSGMKFQGFSKDQRIFGSYGPGTPRDVILSLLEGSGYNVIMVGATPQGAPKELELSTRGQVSAPPTQVTATQASNADEDDSDGGQNAPAEPMPAPSQVFTPPPENPSGQATPPGQNVKTPQQLLQELQQMHDQQQQSPQ